ncbi:uncharacterized protein LOC144441385 [Glandiceps talaboti]
MAQVRVLHIFTLILVCYSIHVFSSHTLCKVYNSTCVDCGYRDLNKLPDDIPSFATYLELSHNVITSLPPNAFKDLQNLEFLDISSNLLTAIPNQQFFYLKSLRTLKIFRNSLTTLSPLSMEGLFNLQHLNLKHNEISDLPDDVFKDLTNLTAISLQQNTLSCLPYKSLLPLKNIEAIDLNYNFFDAECDIITLENFPRLTTLWLSDCNLVEEDLQTLGLEHVALRELTLGGNIITPLTFTFLQNVQNVSKLDLSGNEITGYDLEELSNVFKDHVITTVLEELDLSDNDLNPLPDGGFQWSPQLKILRIDFNELEFIPSGAFTGVEHLLSLDLGSNYLSDITELSFNLQGLFTLEHLYLYTNEFNGEIPQNLFSNLTSLLELNLSYNRFTSINPNCFTFLSALETLDLSSNLFHQIPDSVFSPLTSLKDIGLSGTLTVTRNFIPIIGDNPFRNLTNLIKVSLSPNQIQSLYQTDNEALRYLIITDGAEDALLNLEAFHRIKLPRLTNLFILAVGLTYNCSDQEHKFCDQGHKFPSITTLELFLTPCKEPTTEGLARFLKLFPNLEAFSMKGEQQPMIDSHYIESMNVLPDSWKHLKSLDLTRNQIKQINMDVIKSNPNLKFINIGDNPFDCSGCNMKDFTDWLKTDKKTQVKNVDDFSAYKYLCQKPLNKKGILLYNLSFGWECNLAFIVSVPLVSFFVFIALIITLCVYFQWHIRNLIFQIKLKCRGYDLHVNDEMQLLDMKYDAFIVYNQHDRPWVMQQLVQNLENNDQHNFKLCVHERDFMPGVEIFDNILDSIENSRKTVLILSPQFAESEWCYFEMRMAQNYLFEEKRDVIILVLLEEIPDHLMPRVLRKLLTTKRYIKWTKNKVGQRLFWKKLKLALRKGDKMK